MIKKQYEDIDYMSGNGARRPAIQWEAMQQEAVFSWAMCMEHIFPELSLLYHIPNGGRRDRAEAVNLKRQGVKAGVPDICLPVARGGFHGLYIELKAGDNKPTAKQKEWIAALRAEGYKATVCNGWDSARDTILNYLKTRGEKT